LKPADDGSNLDTVNARKDQEVADIVRRAASGERAAWDSLVARYVSLVWAVALQHGIGESDAADVAQSTWLRLLEHIDEIRDPARIGAWLATTARRESLRIVAMRRRIVLEGGSEAFDGPDRLLAPPDERMLSDERGQSVRQAFGTLPPAWQSLVSLLMSDPPMSYQEIGLELGVPVGSIGPTRGRCMTRMRAALDAM
jgi:RNA polymerase sigma factor (sigma-70 family)